MLGVNIKASEIDIKKAYIKLAKEFHPDRNNSVGAKERFAEILEAYNILSDENKRRIYDTKGLRAKEQEDLEFEEEVEEEKNIPGYFEKEINVDDFNLMKYDKTLHEMYEEMNKLTGKIDKNGRKLIYEGFNNRRDILLTVYLTFLEAVEGCEKTIYYDKYQPNENGLLNSVDCKEKITIPCGVDENTILRLQNKGNAYNIQNSDSNKLNKIFFTTDLYIRLRIKPHEYFIRNDINIETTNYVTLSQAVLGGEIKIKTLKGDYDLEIKPGTKNGDKYVLKGYGISFNNKTGDHIINFKIRLPKLNNEIREIYMKMSEYEKQL